MEVTGVFAGFQVRLVVRALRSSFPRVSFFLLFITSIIFDNIMYILLILTVILYRYYRQAMELRSDEGIVRPVRTPSPDRDLQLLESPRSPSPSVASGSEVSRQEDSASVSYSARTLSITAWSAWVEVSLRARRNSHQRLDAASKSSYSKDSEPKCWDKVFVSNSPFFCYFEYIDYIYI